MPQLVRTINALCLCVLLAGHAVGLMETLPALDGAGVPQTFEAMWAGYDPRAEPLEVEVLHEWEAEGVVMRVVRFRVGVFKGESAWLAAIYGYPKGESGVPGLVQIHGGGQYADHRAVLYNALRGYATVSISWAGRIIAPGYTVDPGGVARFWAGDTDAPGYRVTTDWGALDAYHAPGRGPLNTYVTLEPSAWTLDGVESPRNSGWFLSALAARRAITFLEQQPEVDAERIGVYGHSMGGKLTVMTAAADERVRAAAPSCGGVSERQGRSDLYLATVGDAANLPHVTCPIIFLSPANDFHGRVDDLPAAIDDIQSDLWRITSSPHHNHQDTAAYQVATQLWFDQHLKGAFTYPQTPEVELSLGAADGVPRVTVWADTARPILSLDVYYCTQGQPPGERNDHHNTIHRFWHHAAAHRDGDTWSAALPLDTTDKPLWVYANATYALDEPVRGAGYYYGPYTARTFVLSSVLQVASPESLAEAGVRATLEPTHLIEDFGSGWEKQWFTYDDNIWARRTHKVYAPTWRAPAGARLTLDVRSTDANTLVVGIDGYAAEVALAGGDNWQEVSLTPSDFTDAHGNALSGWEGISELRLGHREVLRSGRDEPKAERVLGGAWRGASPAFRRLAWEPVEPEPGVGAEVKRGAHAAALLSVFPPSTYHADAPGESHLTLEFEPSAGPWVEGVDERAVFQAAITHEQDALNSFELRMGKGGQVYSLAGAFGESVPPSWRANGATSPWNDEVWQFVSVCSRYNMAKDPPAWLDAAAPFAVTYFIHNSGCYLDDADSDLKNLYCPLLASRHDPDERSYAQVNWGLVPQMRTVHRSPLLYYTQVRDIGEGIIELTWVVHNFSTREDVVFDYHNAPWGGTRVSSLPLYYSTTPDGGLLLEDPQAPRARNGIDVRETAGFSIACAEGTPDSPALALVYGRDQHREAEQQRRDNDEPYVQARGTVYRAWRAGAVRYQDQWADFANLPANSFRNYDVAEIIPRLRLAPQSTIWHRSYLVVGGRERCRELAAELVEHVDYGARAFPAGEAPLVDVPGRGDGPGFHLFAHPVAGTLPVFALRDKRTGQVACTTDPYRYTPQEPLDLDVPADHPDADYWRHAVGYQLDGQTEFLGLLGFGYETEPDAEGWVPLSSVRPLQRPGVAPQFDVDVWVQASP